MKRHIAKVATACFHRIRRLRQIHRHVGQVVTTRLLLAMITSRLDYCNSVLVGLPLSTLEPLQKVQNSAARLIFNLHHHDHISQCLVQLHCLPVRARIQYKLCCLMYGIYNNHCSSYISTLYNRPRWCQRVDGYIKLTQLTTSSRDCVLSLQNVVSLLQVRLCGTVCLNHFAKSHPRQPSNAN